EFDTKEQPDFYTNILLFIQSELHLYSYSTRKGLEIAKKEKGAILGRPKIEGEKIKRMQYLYAKEHQSLQEIAFQLNISIGTVHKYTKHLKRRVTSKQ